MKKTSKKAWEIARQYTLDAVPELQTLDNLDGWSDDYFDLAKLNLDEHRKRWLVRVPGSLAPDHIVIGAIQAESNKGIDVTEAEKLIPFVEKAYQEEDHVNLLKGIPTIYSVLANCPKLEGHEYWNYKYYDNFDDVLNEVSFPEKVNLKFTEEEMFERQHAGWLAQIAGGALGTIIEGYTTDQLRKKFGEIRTYLREPSTYNDDVLFEIALMEAVIEKGKEVTSMDIGLNWLAHIPYTWSAEEAALKNMRRGLMPPESGKFYNFWNEWIGAQMRGAICGMVAPGDPKLAAELAWKDGVISHINNGVLGEMFNAVMTSLSFIENDIRDVLVKSIEMLPKKSEYYSVVKFAYDQCLKFDNWEPAWRECEEKYKKYNWIHTYPNAAAQVISLYFGENSFDECMHIVAMCGQDVDCNSNQIGTLYGTMFGYEAISEEWTEPFQDQFESLYKGYENTTITYLAEKSVEAYKKLYK